MEKNNILNPMEYLQSVPVINVPNMLEITPAEHVGAIYYYLMPNGGNPVEVKVNTERNQWYADESVYGDDAASLGLYMMNAMGHSIAEEQIIGMLANGIASMDQKSTERIDCKSLPIIGPQCIAKPYGKHIGHVFLPGISFPVLKDHCIVVYKLKDRDQEDSKEARKYSDLIRKTDDLLSLPEEDKQAILNLFNVSIAMKNVNGGLQLYRDGCTHPEKASGYCLIGDEAIEKGETCYVFENIVDYLALMEMRHKNGTEKIMPPEHHLIINGSDNIKEAMEYLHKRCDYMKVVTLFPNDEEGRAMLATVKAATHQTAKDGSEPYTSLHCFSMSAKAAGRIDYAALEEDRKQLREKFASEIETYKEKHKTSVGKKNDDDVSKKNQRRTILFSSREGPSVADWAKKKTSGFKL